MDVHPNAVTGVERQNPLCRRYLQVSFNQVDLHVSDDVTDSRPQQFRWAVGELFDGQIEVLGVWPASGPNEWNHIFSDLAARGVELIASIVGVQGEAAKRALHSRFVGTLMRDDLGSSGGLNSLQNLIQKQLRFNSRNWQRRSLLGVPAALARVEAVLKRADRVQGRSGKPRPERNLQAEMQ